MRAIVLGVCAVLLVTIVGCGGDPVAAVIQEERAIIEAAKGGKLDPARQTELAKKIANLTPAQREEYGKRKMAEFKDLMQKAFDNMPKPDFKVPDVKIPDVPKIP